MSGTPSELTVDDLLRFFQLKGMERLAYLDHLRRREEKRRGVEWKAAALEEALIVLGRIERMDASLYKDSVLREGEAHSNEPAVMVGPGGRRIPLERPR